MTIWISHHHQQTKWVYFLHHILPGQAPSCSLFFFSIIWCTVSSMFFVKLDAWGHTWNGPNPINTVAILVGACLQMLHNHYWFPPNCNKSHENLILKWTFCCTIFFFFLNNKKFSNSYITFFTEVTYVIKQAICCLIRLSFICYYGWRCSSFCSISDKRTLLTN